MTGQDFDPLTVPAVLQQAVRRINEQGHPTQAALDYEQALQAWMKRNVVAYNLRFTEVSEAVGDSLALITEEAIARATEDAALASLITTVTARVGAAEASIVTETTARVAADGALSTLITNLTASFNGFSANAGIYFAAKAAPAGAASSIGLFTTAGGSFSGLELLSVWGGGSQIALTTDKFTVASPDGANRIEALSWDGATGQFVLNGAMVFRSGSSGERVVITNRNIRVYDGNNVERIAIGIDI